jgi:two-component system LytT family response regulator
VDRTEQSANIRALVVDDEPLARSSLTVLLRRDPKIEIVGECGSGMQAISEIRDKRPDLVFLDVQMPECDGFDVLELLGANLPPALVFVTAYDQYALRAFEAGALDYLLKPFDNARFDRALGRAKERIAQSKTLADKDATSQDVSAKVKRLVVKSAGQALFIKISEIDWIEAADYYVCLHVAKKSHLLRRSLLEIDQALDQTAFCRIHRSAIVNLDRVRGIEVNEAGGHSVVLDDGTRLRLSRRYDKQLQTRLGLRNSASA